ncbi:hypothetical protein Q8F55_002285 [Vanrija albida]|uniref:DUF1688-domain-containing protein n=1 Tax=Vanrija albida TaxID=181172 RepID=A0ABR3Q9E0_9TREE
MAPTTNSTASTPPVVAYLRSLVAVRERSRQVFDLIERDKGDYWIWHPEKLATVVDFCAGLLERDFGTSYDKIPPHCRKNHFVTQTPRPIDRIADLLENPQFPSRDKPVERAATLIDLYIVSVLLDAGAGNQWTYTERDASGNLTWEGGRSEALAVASYHMFVNGVFSAVPGDPLRVDAKALKALTPAILAKNFQVTDTNPMSGLEGRANLLIQLGGALEARPDIVRSGRPGDILYYLQPTLKTGGPKPILSLVTFWDTLFTLLAPIWPSRTTLAEYPDQVLGDVWYCPSLARSHDAIGDQRFEGDALVPFHKLTQWLCYSLLEPIESVAGWRVDPGPGQTGLPEYRNGGLLVDHELLTLRPNSLPNGAYPNGRDGLPVLAPSHPAVVEWRAVTVIALDLIHQGICDKLGLTHDQLNLAQVLEASTWKGGREIAKLKRPLTAGPPIEIISDGTVF